MNVEYLDKFYKDIDKISSKIVKKKIIELIQQIENSSDISQISNVKKLVGFTNAYRIRIGDYRIGIFFQDDIVIFARILHRKDIYKLFP
jgi:mRNA interferase RelE/StbE